MPLKFGYRAAEVRESIWIDDPAVGEVPQAAAEAFAEDGDAEHLRPYVKPGEKATRITFRTLSHDEAATIQTLEVQVSRLRAISMAFRMAVDFPDLGETIGQGSDTYRRIELWKGYRILADGFVKALDEDCPGLSHFYGRLVYEASFPSEVEKKASSQPPTPTKSGGDTAPQTPAPAA